MMIADSLNRNPKVRGNLVTTGHSLGGGLASAAAVATGIHADTFNAAGLNKDTLYEHDENGNDIEIYSGSVANYENASTIIDAYYVDYDLLSYAQDITPVLMPSALGWRTGMDGPYDAVITPHLIQLSLLISLYISTEIPIFGAGAAVMGGVAAPYMAICHFRTTYLYGLLVVEDSTGGIEEDLLGLPYALPEYD